MYSDVTSVNSIFLSDNIINNSDNFYLILENILTNVRSFNFPVIFDTCDVVYNWSISLLPPIVLDNLFVTTDLLLCNCEQFWFLFNLIFSLFLDIHQIPHNKSSLELNGREVSNFPASDWLKFFLHFYGNKLNLNIFINKSIFSLYKQEIRLKLVAIRN